MEKTDKKTAEKATAPKWGTKEWIAAYPWSRMDRKRKRRVLAVLPKETSELLAQDVGYVPYLHALATGVESAKPAASRVVKLLNAIDTSAVKVIDVVVASALEGVWAKEGKR